MLLWYVVEGDTKCGWCSLGPPACGVLGPKNRSLEHAILIQDDQGTTYLATSPTQVTSLAALTAMGCCCVRASSSRQHPVSDPPRSHNVFNLVINQAECGQWPKIAASLICDGIKVSRIGYACTQLEHSHYCLWRPSSTLSDLSPGVRRRVQMDRRNDIQRDVRALPGIVWPR